MMVCQTNHDFVSFQTRGVFTFSHIKMIQELPSRFFETTASSISSGVFLMHLNSSLGRPEVYD